MDLSGYNDRSEDEDDDDVDEEGVEDRIDDSQEELEEEEEEEEEEVVTTPSSNHSVSSGFADKDRSTMEEEEDEELDDDDEEEEDSEGDDTVLRPESIQPRGKPEAIMASMMRAKRDSVGKELDEASEDDDDEDEEDDEEGVVTMSPVAEPVASKVSTVKKSTTKKATAATSKTKELKKTPTLSSKSGPKKKQGLPKSPSNAKLAQPTSQDVENLMDEPTEVISSDQYQNLDSLMEQFCRVPLLSEFSRPVKMLHPDLEGAYKKIIKQPIDLGHVCRGIRRREYQNSRDVRLDMWRVFANCVKFHSHPNNKDKVPSFVSIALHLREYFNSLWQEYMLPSEIPSDASDALTRAIRKRAADRKKRLDNSGVLMMSKKFLMRVSRLLGQFVENGGRTDILDKVPICGPGYDDNPDIREVCRNFKELQTALEEMAGRQEEYSIEDFNRRLQECYSKHGVLEDNPALKNRFRNRLDRLVGKLTAPLHEANSRGVTQSSIWGNIATTIWARESGKKPYWPALCLGILPPEDQREGWHAAVTERNEARLPEKLRAQLMAAKKKCEVAQKRQSLSYFLVEFLGTHEFIWVRETDIVEKFDSKDDPNKVVNVKSKKRASRSAVSSVVGSKTYATALEECEWATDEFEQVLQEAFDFESDKETGEDDGEFMNYSYAVLNQSDDEAEAECTNGYVYDESAMSLSDVEEANWLLAHEGKLDTSTDARKQAKKRAQALKKKKAEEKQKKEAALLSQKKEKKKKLDAKVREREALILQKELDKRRKKRTRDRDKQIKADLRKTKKKRVSGPDPEADKDIRSLGVDDKRARATAIVKAFVHRMAQKEEYKGLYLGGSSAIPAATVESSGLLCMALAFRVAAGELDDTDGTNVKPIPRPWEFIDTETPQTHQERTTRLEKQVKLLEKEIARLRANTSRRKELLLKELEKKAQEEERITKDDKAARFNVFFPQKAKKKNAKGSEKTSTPVAEEPSLSPASPSQNQADSNSEDASRPDDLEDADEEEDVNDESLSNQNEMADDESVSQGDVDRSQEFSNPDDSDA